MSRTKPLSIARAAMRYARADIRPNLLGFGMVGLLLTEAIFFAVHAFFSTVPVDESVDISRRMYSILGCSVGLAGFFLAQICSEVYTDRVGGTLARVRILPHGALAWSVGKVLATGLMVFLSQTILFLGGILVFPDVSLSLPKAIAVLGVELFMLASIAPIGLIMASLIRGLYSQLVILGGVLVLFGTAGLVFPIMVLPGWVQAIQQCLPFYWGGHVVRSLVVDVPFAEASQSFHPLLGLGIMLAWLVIGFALVPSVMQRSFRKETLGMVASLQAAQRQHVGT